MIYEIEKYFQNCMSQIRKLLKGVVTPTHKDYTKGTYIYQINNVCLLLKIVDNRPNTWSRVYKARISTGLTVSDQTTAGARLSAFS